MPLPTLGGSSYSDALGQSQASYASALGGYGGAGGGSNLAPGGLPFDALAGGGNFDFTGNPASLGANYKQAYQGALGFNAALGNQINSGWGQLGQNIQNTIQGITSSQQQAINDQYANQAGTATQGLINAGLGNSTVMSSVQRGIGLDQAKASNNLANQMAGLSAGYMSQIGQGQLGFLNSIQAPYPNAALYGQLGQQWGAAQQANANRQQAADQFSQLLAASKRAIGSGAGAGGGVATGYMPAQTPGMFAPGTGTAVGYPSGLGYNPALQGSMGRSQAIAQPPGVSPGYDNPYAGGFYDWGTPFDAGVAKNFAGIDPGTSKGDSTDPYGVAGPKPGYEDDVGYGWNDDGSMYWE